jgi:hypothetical protein
MTTGALPRALAPEHLTEVLRRAGALGDGHVSRVDVETARDTLISHIVRARPTYEGRAEGTPDRLLLKTARAGEPIGVDAGRKEVAFYDRAAPLTVPGILPRCFEAVCSSMPASSTCSGASSPGSSGTSSTGSPTASRRSVGGSTSGWWTRCRGSSTDTGRTATSRSFTATRTSGTSCTRARRPERRRRLEQPLLDRYHAALVAHGVSGYDRQALAADYRTSVLWQLTTPVWQAEHDLPAVIWWSHLERIFLAVDDLGCRDLLE